MKLSKIEIKDLNKYGLGLYYHPESDSFFVDYRNNFENNTIANIECSEVDYNNPAIISDDRVVELLQNTYTILDNQKRELIFKQFKKLSKTVGVKTQFLFGIVQNPVIVNYNEIKDYFKRLDEIKTYIDSELSNISKTLLYTITNE